MEDISDLRRRAGLQEQMPAMAHQEDNLIDEMYAALLECEPLVRDYPTVYRMVRVALAKAKGAKQKGPADPAEWERAYDDAGGALKHR